MPYQSRTRPFGILDGAWIVGEYRSDEGERGTFRAHNPDSTHMPRQHAFCTALLDAATPALQADPSAACLDAIRESLIDLSAWSTQGKN
ncbi:MAG: hypothetical protein KTR31_32765 [Myxococcales bacterium]|nr:hypothetical protein [Myxococcales bacterium]